MSKRARFIYVLIIIAFFIVTTVGGISAYASWELTHPQRKSLDSTPGALGLNYENVAFSSRVDSLMLKGWFIPSPENKQTIIFAHGYGENRLHDEVPLLQLAQILVNRGFNVLMFDFRNSGESEGNLTSGGQYEVQDLLGAVDFIKTRPDINQKITLFGFSMGASISIIAGAREPAVSGVIADSPFADLNRYLSNRLSNWTNLPNVPFNRTVLAVTPLLTGVNVKEVSPLKEIKKLGNRPLLIIQGEADEDVSKINGELLKREYPSAQLLKIPGATHVKSFQTDNKDYLTEVFRFLEKP